MINRKLLGKIKIEDIILFLSLLFVDYGSFGKLNISQYFVLSGFLYLIVKVALNKSLFQIRLGRLVKVSFILVYILIIGIIFNPDFIQSLSGLIYLIIGYLTFFIYVKNNNLQRIIFLLYRFAVFISFLGILEVFLYFYSSVR